MKFSNSRALAFMKRNAAYFVIALCIIAVGLSVTLMLLIGGQPINDSTGTGDNNQVVDPVGPSDEDPTPSGPNEPVIEIVSFIMPVESITGIADYSEQMVFNSTLSRYSAHKAIDFYAPEGSSVFAVYDGVIESIDNTLLTGVTVTINHGNNLKTVYNSIAENDNLFVGQKVKQGTVIGTVSVTNRQEYKSGAHLHFETIENGEVIDPAKYLTIEEK